MSKTIFLNSKKLKSLKKVKLTAGNSAIVPGYVGIPGGKTANPRGGVFRPDCFCRDGASLTAGRGAGTRNKPCGGGFGGVEHWMPEPPGDGACARGFLGVGCTMPDPPAIGASGMTMIIGPLPL